MINFVQELFSYGFIIRAFIAGSLIALCAALLGVILVLKRYSMIGDGLSHVGFGTMAGVGGAVQILGMAGRISQFAGQEGYGFQGITVALIAGSNPLGCILSGIFYGAMKYGGSKLTIVGAPKEVINIIMGVVIIFIAVSHVFKALLTKAAKKKEVK